MGAKIVGLGAAKTDLLQFGDKTTRASRRQIEIEAEEVKKLSERNAPKKTGNLESSHKVSKGKDGRRKKMVIEYEAVNRETNFDYGTYLHEDPDWELGEVSEQKNTQNGGHVGPKFLERAVEEREPEMMRNMERAVRDLK
jgi:hypothetical protein